MVNSLVQELDVAWTLLSAALREYRCNWRGDNGQELYDKAMLAQKEFDRILEKCQEYRKTMLRL